MPQSQSSGRLSVFNVANIALWGLIGLLLWLPWPYGSNYPLPIAVAGVWTGTLLFILAFATLFKTKLSIRLPWAVMLASCLFAGAVIWVMLQPRTFWPDEWSHPVWLILDGSGIEAEPRIVVNAAAHRSSMLVMLTSVGVFWLSFVLCANRHRTRLMLMAILAIVSFYSILGLIIGLTGWKPLDDLTDGNFIASTFINRNHFATYVNMGFLIALACVFAVAPSQHERLDEPARRRGYWVAAVLRPIETAPLLTVAMMLCLLALLATLSRGGLVSLLAALVVFLALQRAGATHSSKRALGASLLLFTLIGGALFLVGQPVLERFDDLGGEAAVEGGGRMAIWSRTIELIGQSPWLGYGLGGYEDLFRMFADARFTGIVDHAHNDYVELVAELGIPAASAIFAAIIVLVLYCASLTAVSGRLERRAAMAALLCAVAVGVHALMDFSLTIPAVAITFAAVLGMGAAQGLHLSDYA